MFYLEEEMIIVMVVLASTNYSPNPDKGKTSKCDMESVVCRALPVADIYCTDRRKLLLLAYPVFFFP